MNENSLSQNIILPNNWTTAKINDLCEFIVDCIHHTPELSESPTGYFMVRTSDVGGGHVRLENARFISKEVYEDRIQRGKPQWGDIIISREAPLGNVGQILTDKNICLGQRLIHYRPNKNIVDIRYLLFALLSPMVQRQFRTNEGRGSIVDNLLMQTAKDLLIPIPPLSTQQKIAAVLSALDAKIELNQRINAELESMAKTLYDYWFVQFAPHKSAGGKMVWNEELKRDVPAGWEVCELRKYVTSKRGVSYSGKDIVGDGVPMINLNSFNMGNGSYKPEGIKTYSGDYGENKILKPFDLVMCNTQQTALDPKKDIIGKSFLIPDIFDSDIVSSHHVTNVIVEKENLKYYLNSLFNTDYFHRYISGYATGTNILGLNFEGVLSYKTAIPNDDLLESYKSIVLNVEKRKAVIIKESQTLTELRDWLLSMLMNGQVKVS